MINKKPKTRTSKTSGKINTDYYIWWGLARPELNGRKQSKMGQ
jgi:hypothetical protein